MILSLLTVLFYWWRCTVALSSATLLYDACTHVRMILIMLVTDSEWNMGGLVTSLHCVSTFVIPIFAFRHRTMFVCYPSHVSVFALRKIVIQSFSLNVANIIGEMHFVHVRFWLFVICTQC
jgi:hypothetical protein